MAGEPTRPRRPAHGHAARRHPDGDILAVLVPIWHDKHETARRVRQRIGRVCDWAVALGLRPDNPAGPALTAALPRSEGKADHFRTVGYEGAGAAVRAVRATGAWWAAKRRSSS